MILCTPSAIFYFFHFLTIWWLLPSQPRPSNICLKFKTLGILRQLLYWVSHEKGWGHFGTIFFLVRKAKLLSVAISLFLTHLAIIIKLKKSKSFHVASFGVLFYGTPNDKLKKIFFSLLTFPFFFLFSIWTECKKPSFVQPKGSFLPLWYHQNPSVWLVLHFVLPLALTVFSFIQKYFFCLFICLV